MSQRGRLGRRLSTVVVVVLGLGLGLGAGPATAAAVSLQVVGEVPNVVTAPQATWVFATSPASAAGELVLTLTRDDQVTTTYTGAASSSGSISVQATGLAPGYYDVTVAFPQAAPWTGSLVVADGPVAQDVRLGVDGGLSWSGTDLEYISRASATMKAVGIGSVRDRFTWTAGQADPKHTPGTVPDCSGWDTKAWSGIGSFYVSSTKLMKDAGMEVVTAVAGPPICSRPAGSTTGTDAPVDYDAVYAFGQTFAKNMTSVGAVEYLNEQVAPVFFQGYPFQFASGFKAFAAGVKSVRPDLLVLPGTDLVAKLPGTDTAWGVLYQAETLANGTAVVFDVRNQHWYGTNTQALVHEFDTTTDAVSTSFGTTSRPKWLTEMGYSVKNAGGEQGQAAYATQTYAIGLASGFARVYPFFWMEYLEQCPAAANTDTCGLVWGLTRAARSDKYRDGRSQDMSPRPAVAAMAAMTRHVGGREVTQVTTSPTGATVHFSGGVAVTWDSARKISDFGSGVTVKNMYGRVVASTVTPDASHPYLLSNVAAVPGGGEGVTVPGKNVKPRGAQPLRLEVAQLQVDDVDQVRRTDWNPLVPLAAGDTVRMVVRARSGATDVAASTDFECQASEGLAVLGEAHTPTGYACELQAVEVPVPQLTQWPYQVSHVTITATRNGVTDTAQVAFSGDGQVYTAPLASSELQIEATGATTTVPPPSRAGADLWRLLLALLLAMLIVGTALVIVRRRRAQVQSPSA